MTKQNNKHPRMINGQSGTHAEVETSIPVTNNWQDDFRERFGKEIEELEIRAKVFPHQVGLANKDIISYIDQNFIHRKKHEEIVEDLENEIFEANEHIDLLSD